MDLKTRIMEAMKAAMKDRDKPRVAAFRLIRDAIQKDELDKNDELDDAGVISILSYMVKKRQESVEAYRSGDREDLAKAEENEISIIREFLPEQMNEDDLRALVAGAIKDAAAESPKDMGNVMKALKGKYEGRASGKDVSGEVKRQLNELASS